MDFCCANQALFNKKRIAKRSLTGFTLVEALIAIALFSVVAVSAFQAFRTGFIAYRNIEETLGKDHVIQMLVRQLNQELRNAIYYADAPFIGESDQIQFPARLWRYEDQMFQEDLYVVTYQFRGRKLERSEEKMRKKFSKKQSSKETLLSLQTFKFQYAYKLRDGGIEWRNEWSRDRYMGLPRAIRISFKEKKVKRSEPEHVFQFLLPHGILGEVR